MSLSATCYPVKYLPLSVLTTFVSTVAFKMVSGKMCVVLLCIGLVGLFQRAASSTFRHGHDSETTHEGIKCSAPVTQLGGQSTLTFDFADDLLRSGQRFYLNVQRDDANVTDRAMMCLWNTSNHQGSLKEVCSPTSGYRVSSVDGRSVTLTIPNTRARDLGTYLATLKVMPGDMTLKIACVLHTQQDDPRINCSASDAGDGEGATLTIDLSPDLLRSGEVFALNVGPRSHVTDMPLKCVWNSGDQGPLAEACFPAQGYSVSSGDDRSVTLTIPNTSARDLGRYHATLDVMPGDRTVETTCVLRQAQRDPANLQARHCEAPPVRMGGPATLSLHLGDRLKDVHSFYLKVFKNTATGISAEPVLTCDWVVDVDGLSLSKDCLRGADRHDYNISGTVGGDDPITITKLRTTIQDLGTYSLSLQTFPGPETTRETCLIELKEGETGTSGPGTSGPFAWSAEATRVIPSVIAVIGLVAVLFLLLIAIGKAKL